MSQLQKRKFRKGAVHSRKKVFTNNKEKIKRNCNLCQKEVIFDTKFITKPYSILDCQFSYTMIEYHIIIFSLYKKYCKSFFKIIFIYLL